MRYLLFAVCLSLTAAPPGASVRVKLQVDQSLRRGAFATDRYLNLPPGFSVSLQAIVGGARFMAVAPNGDLFVSQPGNGRIAILRGSQTFTYVSGLRRPHDMVFHTIGDTTWLYVSEVNQVNRYKYVPGDTTAHDREIVVRNLPDASLPELRGSYGHELKNIALGSDHKLYVSIASTCNVCVEDTTSNPVRAAIYVYDADGSNGRIFARGLRNAEGLDFLPGTNTLWVTVNSRDNAPNPADGRVTQSYVDNHPPDLFTAVRDGGNYGWPFCNSNPDAGLANMPLDRDMDMNRNGSVDCGQMDKASRGIQAHSAALGFLFLQNTAFAAPYRSGAAIALHGSWNRAQRTGYKVIWYPPTGDALDLATGFDGGEAEGVWARPVDVAVDRDGALLVSDDMAGGIFRIVYDPASVSSASGYAVVAPNSIASIYGSDLPTGELTVGGVAPKTFYTSAKQINYLVPGTLAAGDAAIRIGTRDLGTVQVARVAPGLYSMPGGVAAATAIRRVIATRIDSPVDVFRCDAGGTDCTAVPIDVGVDAPVYVSLYATGIRNASGVTVTIDGEPVPVQFWGPQGAYEGLDQINFPLPLSLRGKGDVEIVAVADGVSSNSVKISIQ